MVCITPGSEVLKCLSEVLKRVTLGSLLVHISAGNPP